MTLQGQRESARIIPFPGRRFGTAFRLPKPDALQQIEAALPPVAAESAWYHEAAVEADRAARQ